MSRLRMLQVVMATVVLSAGLAVVPIMAAGTTQTFTGKVSDAMCGAKHTEGLAPAACVRACVQTVSYTHLRQDVVEAQWRAVDPILGNVTPVPVSYTHLRPCRERRDSTGR